ncbi:MAG: ABC transporter ATP-binding protein [Hyphomicrobiales bacterium]|nr:ABC transporter ATP-binding protein [Hyphomicrobiales bacterium]
MTAVSIKNIAVEFGGVSVIDNLSIDIDEGELIVLLGPSGCGKSTLLNGIAGLIDLSKGQIWIGGKNVTWAEPKARGIGMVFQSYSLYPRMTVEGNLSFGLRIAGARKKEIAARVGRAAKMLHLEPLLRRRPSQLSGGQRQRVAIGRALVRNCDVFLFDEPLSNLDAKLRNELRIEIKKLHQEIGNTMIYVTHDQVEAMTLADRIAVMKSGVIQQFATPRDIYHRPVNMFVAGFIGSPAMNMIEGEIAPRDGSADFHCEAGAVDLTRYDFSGPPQAGAAVLGVRPEHIGIGPAPSGRHGGRGKVTLIEPMGGETVAWTEFAGRPLVVKTDGEIDIALGETIDFHFDAARASLFDAASQDRL